MKSSKNRSPVCTRSSISILGDSQGQADHVKEGSSAVTTTKAKESIAGKPINNSNFFYSESYKITRLNIVRPA